MDFQRLSITQTNFFGCALKEKFRTAEDLETSKSTSVQGHQSVVVYNWLGSIDINHTAEKPGEAKIR